MTLIAPIQPWSACGAEKPIVTALPGLALSFAGRAAAAALLSAPAGSLLREAALGDAASCGTTVSSGPERPVRPSSDSAGRGAGRTGDVAVATDDLVVWLTIIRD